MKDEALQIIRARNVLISFSVSYFQQRFFFSSLKPGGMIVHTIPQLKSRGMHPPPPPPPLSTPLGGGGGQDSQIFRQEKNHVSHMCERAPQKHNIFSCRQNTSYICIMLSIQIKAVPFSYSLYGGWGSKGAFMLNFWGQKSAFSNVVRAKRCCVHAYFRINGVSKRGFRINSVSKRRFKTGCVHA